MNQIIRNQLKNIYYVLNKSSFGKKILNYGFIFRKENRKFKNLKKSGIYTFKNLINIYSPSINLQKGEQLIDLFKKLNINIPLTGFIYSIDEFKTLMTKDNIIDNISVDYSKIINSSLNDIRSKYNSSKTINQHYLNNQLDLITAIEILLVKEIDALDDSNRKDKEKYKNFLKNIKNQKCESFEEGLQRILFFNQVFWQTGHKLNGLGRLDKVLNDLYYNDLNNDVINKEKSLKLIKKFLNTLHQYYWYKSNELMGDTGQIIVLGGKEENEEYFCNDLTYLFIEALQDLNIPDPKILLRVCDKTPHNLMEKALKSITCGIGSPLLSNDDKIISNLINFGYSQKDASNYVVSACWEPAPIAKGLEVNNLNCIIFLNPLNELLDYENLSNIHNFRELVNLYKIYLKKYIKNFIKSLNKIIWEEDPLLSFFIDNCDEKQIDISEGGAFYNNYGVTSVSLGNTVNSLYNIKKFVFDEGKYSLTELNNYRKNNFKENEDLCLKLKNQQIRFGTDNDEIISLSNEITGYVNELFKINTNSLGGKFKFGLSAPSFISNSQKVKASFDGRYDFDPFNVHISSETGNDYTGLMRFASKLQYSGCRFNGNVVDFMVNPDFIKKNFLKFLDFLILSVRLGFFQMQMNVISSKILINAKNRPEKYSNLIVRVWGFSAYFNDLPLSYQDLLIDRALKNECKF